MNLPEQICKNCVEDLDIAYRFRTNCESSEAILKSFTESSISNESETLPSTIDSNTDLVLNSNSGEIYKFRPPSGLNVRRVKTQIKEEPQDSFEFNQIPINSRVETESFKEEYSTEDLQDTSSNLEDDPNIYMNHNIQIIDENNQTIIFAPADVHG